MWTLGDLHFWSVFSIQHIATYNKIPSIKKYLKHLKKFLVSSLNSSHRRYNKSQKNFGFSTWSIRSLPHILSPNVNPFASATHQSTIFSIFIMCLCVYIFFLYIIFVVVIGLTEFCIFLYFRLKIFCLTPTWILKLPILASLISTHATSCWQRGAAPHRTPPQRCSRARNTWVRKSMFG